MVKGEEEINEIKTYGFQLFTARSIYQGNSVTFPLRRLFLGDGKEALRTIHNFFLKNIANCNAYRFLTRKSVRFASHSQHNLVTPDDADPKYL